MFQNPFAVFFAILVIGFTLIGQYDDICRLGDCFNGNALSPKHQAEHIDRDFRGFFHLLAFAVFAGFVVLLFNCLNDDDYQPKKVFIKDLVSPQARASEATKHKAKAQSHTATGHAPVHKPGTQAQHQKTGAQTIKQNHGKSHLQSSH